MQRDKYVKSRPRLTLASFKLERVTAFGLGLSAGFMAQRCKKATLFRRGSTRLTGEGTIWELVRSFMRLYTHTQLNGQMPSQHPGKGLREANVYRILFQC